MIDLKQKAEHSSPSFPPIKTPLSRDWGVFILALGLTMGLTDVT